ncbi:MAG: UDP-4-amino-4,6-dideoxy-N-acetyl-beta-L-altrosamine N-acetyltransferase [Rhizobiaceae bacterium]
MQTKTGLQERAMALELVPLTTCDRETQMALRDIRNHPDVRRFMYSDHSLTVEEHEDWLDSQSSRPSNANYLALRDGSIAGMAGLIGIDPDNRHAEWGFYVTPAMRGQGLGLAMLFKLLDIAFRDYPLDKINAEVIADNDASLAIHRQLGFVIEGRRRRHKMREGVAVDAILYGITRLEWETARKELVNAMGQ